MTDVETALRAAMVDATTDLFADPSAFLLRSPRRRWPALTAAAAVVAVVGGASLLGHETKRADQVGTPTERNTSVASVFGTWGPTRGDRAGDTGYLAKVRAEWDHPQGQGRVAGFVALQNPQDDFTVLWAGMTPVGPAAVAAQTESQSPGSTDVSIGILIPDAAGDPRMVQQLNIVDGFQNANDGTPDPDGFVLSPDRLGRYVVVVPADPDAAVTVSPRHSRAGGKVVRDFAAVPVKNDVAIADLGASHVAGDEIVRVAAGGRTVVDQGIAATLAPFVAEPTNLVPEWGVNGMFLGGNRADGFGVGEMTVPWLRSLGAPDSQPVMSSPWGGPIALTPEGGRVFVEQVYLPAEPAHVVVMQEDAKQRDSEEADVVSDTTTAATSKPLFATRLKRSQGWFVGSGPGAQIDGWRDSGGGWHDVTPFKAALLRTDAATLELRFTDGSTVTVGTP